MVEDAKEVPRFRRWLRSIPWRPVIGLGAIGLIVVGIWGLWGWQWATITIGLPPAIFYIYGEIVEVRHKLTTANPPEGN